MTKEQLYRVIEELQKLDVKKPGVDTLNYDLMNIYLPGLTGGSGGGAFSLWCVEMWDALCYHRLCNLPVGVDLKLLERAKAYTPKSTLTVPPRVLFGQMRIAPDFQSSGTVNQAGIEGFPQDQIIGRSIAVVSGDLANNQIRADQIPVQIFYSRAHQSWICANNRGYTAFCRSGVRPLRFWPRDPSQDELNRLKEVEGTHPIGDFVFSHGCVRPSGAARRTLPAEQMFVTNGPSSWNVVEVVPIPHGW